MKLSKLDDDVLGRWSEASTCHNCTQDSRLLHEACGQAVVTERKGLHGLRIGDKDGGRLTWQKGKSAIVCFDGWNPGGSYRWIASMRFLIHHEEKYWTQGRTFVCRGATLKASPYKPHALLTNDPTVIADGDSTGYRYQVYQCMCVHCNDQPPSGRISTIYGAVRFAMSTTAGCEPTQ